MIVETAEYWAVYVPGTGWVASPLRARGRMFVPNIRDAKWWNDPAAAGRAAARHEHGRPVRIQITPTRKDP